MIDPRVARAACRAVHLVCRHNTHSQTSPSRLARHHSPKLDSVGASSLRLFGKLYCSSRGRGARLLHAYREEGSWQGQRVAHVIVSKDGTETESQGALGISCLTPDSNLAAGPSQNGHDDQPCRPAGDRQPQVNTFRKMPLRDMPLRHFSPDPDGLFSLVPRGLSARPAAPAPCLAPCGSRPQDLSSVETGPGRDAQAIPAHCRSTPFRHCIPTYR